MRQTRDLRRGRWIYGWWEWRTHTGTEAGRVVMESCLHVFQSFLLLDAGHRSFPCYVDSFIAQNIERQWEEVLFHTWKKMTEAKKFIGTLKVDGHIFGSLGTNDGQGGYQQTYTLDSRETGQRDIGRAAWLVVPQGGLLGLSHMPCLILSLLPCHGCPSSLCDTQAYISPVLNLTVVPCPAKGTIQNMYQCWGSKGL